MRLAAYLEEESVPRSYAPQFRAMVVDQVRAGRRVAEVAAAVEVSEATVYRWIPQDQIDRGELAGTSTGDNCPAAGGSPAHR